MTETIPETPDNSPSTTTTVIADMLQQAMQHSEEVHTQAMQNMSDIAERVNARLYPGVAAAVSRPLPDMALVQHAAQLDAEFWSSTLAVARSIIKRHEESQPDASE